MDKRIKKTQRTLKQTMITLLKEQHIEDITVTDICDKSDIVRRTFYAHFNDKYDLVERIMSDYISDFVEICHFKEQINFKLGNIKWFEYLYNNKDIFSVLFKSSISALFSKKLETVIYKQLENKIAKSVINEGISKSTLLCFLTSAVLGVMVNFALNGDSDYQNKADETLILLKPYLKNDILNS
ncbi:TPA: TetR/AcrR family transcriptional regulator [Staphylococcus aureus]|jgi:AcrR family transcriptional regulator|nr:MULTISPECIES: TetR/AcrR family transcriptional regulator [Staphylococcus]HDH6294997.1 TetR/AcrR family transcriptional regulator [Staphylococcus aureus LTCF-1-17]HDK8976726.1 TetR/AcrR family transcriptional regulator [Staphylococcus aureus USA600-NRS22]HDK9079769.1 TetR/AcrR family transcriptional regulator [Staphylococcus aureus USA600-BAA1754]HDK9083043.1 TetR/AcrR family transcriptional regulator [Staphylococcus aureus USA600-BAA1751]HDQ3542205.1 TetR/AcrR family transcriptional regulat